MARSAEFCKAAMAVVVLLSFASAALAMNCYTCSVALTTQQSTDMTNKAAQLQTAMLKQSQDLQQQLATLAAQQPPDQKKLEDLQKRATQLAADADTQLKKFMQQSVWDVMKSKMKDCPSVKCSAGQDRCASIVPTGADNKPNNITVGCQTAAICTSNREYACCTGDNCNISSGSGANLASMVLIGVFTVVALAWRS